MNILRSYLNWWHNWQLKSSRRSHTLKGSHSMRDGRIFLKTRPDNSFNKVLSNEPNFGRIHLAGQYLSGPLCTVFNFFSSLVWIIDIFFSRFPFTYLFLCGALAESSRSYSSIVVFISVDPLVCSGNATKHAQQRVVIYRQSVIQQFILSLPCLLFYIFLLL